MQAERISTGVPGLDDVLGGGLPVGRLYLVIGEPGTGKTTLGLQFLQAGTRRGERVLYITLTESAAELEAVADSHGWNLAGVEIQELTPPESTFEPDGQYTIFDPGELEIGETLQTLGETVARIQPRRIVVDSVTELRLLASDPLRFRRQIFALKHMFDDATVLLLERRSAHPEDHPHTIAHGLIELDHMPRTYGAALRRLRVLKLRASDFRSGYHDLTIRTGGVCVYPRLIAAQHGDVAGGAPMSSGVPELDRLLGDGLHRGTSTLIMGPAGTGKSSLATQFVLSAARCGEASAVYLFDEGRRNFLLRAAGLGLDLVPHVESGTIRIESIDPAELSPGEFASHAVQAADEGARVVVIDSVNGYLNANLEERFLPLHLHELLSFLNRRGIVTILLVAQHGVLGAGVEAPIDISYLADTVVLLRYFETAGRVRQAMSVVKKRTGNHERTIREVALTPSGIRVGPPLTDFQGVLSGVPTFLGTSPPLLHDGTSVE